MKSRMSIAIVRATHLCIQGSRIPTSRMSQHPQWGDGAGLPLGEQQTYLKIEQKSQGEKYLTGDQR